MIIQRSADDGGAYISACQQTQGQTAKSLLKGGLSKGAYLNVLVFLCSSTSGHMYTEAGARSHTSFFVCICLAVFIVLSLLSLSLSLFHHSSGPLLSCYLTFLLCTYYSSVISLEITSCSWQFQDDTPMFKMLRLANIVWAFLWEKLLRGAADNAMPNVYLLLFQSFFVLWQKRRYQEKRARWSYPAIFIWSLNLWYCLLMGNGNMCIEPDIPTQ